MKKGMPQALRLLGGSLLVYIIVAACTGGDSLQRHATSSGSGGAGGAQQTGAGGEHGAVRDADGLVDAITDPVPDAHAQTTGGTRLKAEYIVADDGSRQPWYYWYDSQRQEDCAFGVAADGTTRCLPSGTAYWFGDTIGQFSDSACRQRLGVISVSCSTSQPKYVRETVTSVAGCAGTRLYLAGAAFAGMLYHLVPGGDGGAATCQLTGPTSAQTGTLYYAVGSEVPATSFVAGRVVTEQ